MDKHALENANSRNESAKRRKKIKAVVQWVLAIIVLLIIIFPIYWMLVSSVKSQEEILLAVPTLWPREFHFENYINVLNRGNFAKYYWNTAVMTAGILISQVVTGIFAGYGFSKGKFKGQGLCFVVVLGALMIPIQVTFIPLYIMIANWGLSDTFLGLILPDVVSPYYIFMLRQSFMGSYCQTSPNSPPVPEKARYGQEYDHKQDEILKWISERPGLLMYVFDKLVQGKYIKYDSDTGTWQGVDYDG